jgi:hypothetical protein
MDSTFAPSGPKSLLNCGLWTLPSLAGEQPRPWDSPSTGQKCRPIPETPHSWLSSAESGNLPCLPTMDSTFACQGLYHHPSRTLPSQGKDSAFTWFAPQLALSMVYTSYPEDSACAN